MARQVCKTVYKFDELSDEAKEKAIEKRIKNCAPRSAPMRKITSRR